MIHYINGVPAKNVQLNKSKARAIKAYRQTQRKQAIKHFAIDLLAMALVCVALAATFLVIT